MDNVDFTILIEPLGKDYDNVEEAVESLNTWYKNEGYEPNDVKRIIFEDWDGEFEDSEGIRVLSDILNPVEGKRKLSQKEKRKLYSLIRYYLLPPTTQSIRHPFIQNLIEKLQIPETDANSMVETFIQHVEEHQYDIEDIEDDLFNVHESEIIDYIIEKFPNLGYRKSRIFDILYDVVTNLYVIFESRYLKQTIEIDDSSTEDINEPNKSIKQKNSKDMFQDILLKSSDTHHIANVKIIHALIKQFKQERTKYETLKEKHEKIIDESQQKQQNIDEYEEKYEKLKEKYEKLMNKFQQKQEKLGECE
eukprot:401259_1